MDSNRCSVGSNNCGPESCNNLETVKACNNTDYCIQNVWLQSFDVSKNKDDVCDICLKMVQEVSDALHSESFKEDLEEVVKQTCELMHFRPVVKECISFIDKYLPDFIKMLQSQVDPQVVCAVSKLCQGGKLQDKFEELDNCATCQDFTSVALNAVEKLPKAEFQKEMILLCRGLSSYSDACVRYVIQNFDSYYENSKSALKKDSCLVTGVCRKDIVDDAQSGRTQLMVDAIPGEESYKTMCSMCPKIAEKLKNFVRSFHTPEDFKNHANMMCKGLASDVSCSNFVSDYYRVIYETLRQNFDSDLFCGQFVEYCKRPFISPIWPVMYPSNDTVEINTVAIPKGSMSVSVIKEEKKNKSSNKFQISPGDPIRVELSRGDYIQAPLSPLPITRFLGTDTEKCTACIQMYETILNRSLTYASVMPNTLVNQCEEVEKRNAGNCTAMGKQVSEKIRKIFSESLGPANVCPYLVPLCEVGPFPVQIQQQQSDATCKFCKDVVHRYGNFGPQVLNDITDEFKRLCSSLEKTYQKPCGEFVTAFEKNNHLYLSMINETCDILELCESPDVKSVVEAPHVGGGNCKTCLLMMETLIIELRDNKTEEEVKKAVDHLCHILPKVGKQCEMIVNTYYDQIIKMVVDGLRPNEICEMLHFCSKADKKVEIEKVKSVENVSGKVPCNFCMAALKMLIDELGDDKNEAEIRKALDGLCKYFPEEVTDTCKNLINEYTEDIIDMIIADFNATEICIYIKLCKPTKSNPSELYKVFSIETNEVRNELSPADTCDFCKFLESSMKLYSNESVWPEKMFSLLTEICSIDVIDPYRNCSKKFTEKVLPLGANALVHMDDICREFDLCPRRYSELKSGEKILEKIHNFVQECAMCEAIVQIISTHKQMWTQDYDFSGNASRICSRVPRNKKKECESMLISYAPSMVHLLADEHVDPNEVCFHVKLCDESAQTKVNMPVTDVEQGGIHNSNPSGECLQGPSFWCGSYENAKKCGTVPHCKETVWPNGEPPK